MYLYTVNNQGENNCWVDHNKETIMVEGYKYNYTMAWQQALSRNQPLNRFGQGAGNPLFPNHRWQKTEVGISVNHRRIAALSLSHFRSVTAKRA